MSKYLTRRDVVMRLRRLVTEHGSQLAVARAAGAAHCQVSNALRGYPTKDAMIPPRVLKLMKLRAEVVYFEEDEK